MQPALTSSLWLKREGSQTTTTTTRHETAIASGRHFSGGPPTLNPPKNGDRRRRREMQAVKESDDPLALKTKNKASAGEGRAVAACQVPVILPNSFETTVPNR